MKLLIWKLSHGNSFTLSIPSDKNKCLLFKEKIFVHKQEKTKQ